MWRLFILWGGIGVAPLAASADIQSEVLGVQAASELLRDDGGTLSLLQLKKSRSQGEPRISNRDYLYYLNTPKCQHGAKVGDCPVDGHCQLNSYSEFHWAFYDLVPDQLPDFHVKGEVPLLRSTDNTVQMNMMALGLPTLDGKVREAGDALVHGDRRDPYETIVAVAAKADGNLLEIVVEDIDFSVREDFLVATKTNVDSAMAKWTDTCKSLLESRGDGPSFSLVLKKLQHYKDMYDYYAYIGTPVKRMLGGFWRNPRGGLRPFETCMYGVEKPWPRLYMNGNLIDIMGPIFFAKNRDDVDQHPSRAVWYPLPGFTDWEYVKKSSMYYIRYKHNFCPDCERQKAKLMFAVQFVRGEDLDKVFHGGVLQSVDIILHPSLIPPKESLPDGTMCGYGLDDVSKRPTATDTTLFSAGSSEKMCAAYGHPELPCPPPTTPPPPTTTTTTEVKVKDICAEYGTKFEDAQEKCRELEGLDTHSRCLRDFCIEGNPELDVGTTTFTTTTPTPTTSTSTTTMPITTSLASTTPIPSVEKCICTDPPALSLRTPRSSNLGGLGPDTGVPEGIVYPDAGVIRGQAVDVRVEASSTYAGKASMNGIKGELGRLNLNTGSSLSFTIAVVDQVTGLPVDVGPLPITWLDLDEGRGGKGRATVKICGATQSVAGDSELTLSEIDGCLAASSSTRGTAKDNPSSVQGALVDPVAKKRVVSYVIQPNADSKYPVSIEIAKGFKQRNLLWSFSTGMTCVDENLPPECRDALDEEG